MTAGQNELQDSWWFDVWQPEAMASEPTSKSDWVLKPGDDWHGFEALAEPCPGRSDQGHPL